MKNLLYNAVFGKDLKLTSLLAVGILIFVGLGCGSGKSGDAKPVPSEYFGVWTGQDGSSLTIRGDGKGDYKSGNTKVDGGTVEIDDAKKELSITFLGMGPSLKIDSPPAGDEMKLGGVTYRRNGGSTTGKTNGSDDKKSGAPANGDVPSDDELQDMAKTSMLDFNDAIRRGDFTDFYPTISKSWQNSTSPAKLKNSFKVFIDNKVDFSQVRKLNANFAGAPTYDDSYGYHEMVLTGRYETSPTPTKFRLSYIQESGEWKLIGVYVNNNKD